jgi:hypothetical protein
MIRAVAVSLILSSLATTSSAQSPPAPGTAATPATAASVKPVAKKKPAPKDKAAAKPANPTETGPCRLGVIPVVGDRIGVKKIGFTVFGNEYAEVPVEHWGLDDVVVARVRAAAGAGVRRLAYPKGTFAGFENPGGGLFRNAEADLAALVRQVAGNANCERYVVVTKLEAAFGGTNQTVSGASIVVTGIGDLVRHTYMLAHVHVRVFDGHSFAIRKPPIDFGAVLAATFKGQRLREIDHVSFPVSAPQIAGDPKLRDEARAELAEALDRALPTLLKE